MNFIARCSMAIAPLLFFVLLHVVRYPPPTTNSASKKIEKSPPPFVTSSANISGKLIRYVYPEVVHHWDTPLALGILSSMGNAEYRSNIRKTWASNQTAVFIVASTSPDEWMDEMEQYKDLLVIHAEEAYQGENSVLSYKTQAFFHAISTRATSYDFLMKADDDSFVDIHRLRNELNRTQPNYWGRVIHGTPGLRDPSHKWFVNKSIHGPRFIDYCQGSGYVLSRTFADCAVGKLKSLDFMPIEDAATGILAKKCKVKPVHNHDVDRPSRGPSDTMIVQHRVKTREDVMKLWKLTKAIAK